ncbi:MAG: hypothetical protein KME17_21495 [Cyanosarcina radialis HA8281-LM2]|jgi:hypothetical protein|nr:hypothetical protein [Cyanosarcina radialis HA8281-LM2]
MTSEVLSNSVQIQKLRVAEVVNYLQQNGWVAIAHRNPRLLVFEKGVDDRGKPIQIVLPSQDDYEDTPYLLTKAVNLLSVLQSMSFEEMVTAIDSDPRDR